MPPVFLSPNLENFQCSVCWDLCGREPVMTPCQHLFCRECVEPMRLCPLCRAPFHAGQLQASDFVRRVIAGFDVDAVEVKCGRAGCHWKGRHKDFQQHDAACAVKLLAEKTSQLAAKTQELEDKKLELASVAREMERLKKEHADTVRLKVAVVTNACHEVIQEHAKEWNELRQERDRYYKAFADGAAAAAANSKPHPAGVWVADNHGNMLHCFRNIVDQVNAEVPAPCPAMKRRRRH